jgi:hypothetical protein
MESLVKNLSDGLVKAQADVEALKKSTTTSASEMTKAILEVARMKSEMAKLAAMPVAPRPQVGTEALVRKGEGTVDVRPADNLEKSGAGDAETFVKGIESESDSLLKMKSARPWTEEESKKAQYIGNVLKVSKALGAEAAFKQYGKKC